MDIKKLKIDNFKNIMLKNFPDDIELGINSSDNNPEVVIYYIDFLEDIEDLKKLVNEIDLPKENRIILVYKKGRKDDVNRDNIISPFKNNKNYKMKAPMLCSLSKELSAFSLQKIN
jgi:hypothetical protein